MKKKFFISLLIACIGLTALADDSIKSKCPQFIAVNLSDGIILPTRKVVSGKHIAPHLTALTLKYGFKAKGNSWQDYEFGLPYKGIGVYLPHFSRKEMGDPFSVFLFQGGRLKELNTRTSLHYEINLGASFNWKHYDTFDNPAFIALGSSVNVHLAGSWYFKWKLSQKFDLHTGLSINHYSNGALRTPNNGLNSLSAFVELAYNLHAKEETKLMDKATFLPPKFNKRTAHDFAVMFTTRTIKLDELENDLMSKYPRKRFKVAGISYSYMLHNTRRFMWGPSIESVYDESANASFWGETDAHTGKYSEYCKLGKPEDRFSVGLSLKGEVTMPGYSIFANLGYDVLHPNKRDQRLYQIYGLKVYLVDNLFATFGVRSTNLTRSQYLYLNIGYTINQYRKK
ncbi:acyloxyacyl hydrolase [Bacteroides sp. 224]|uniref:acyloxyacyl hydrolase n=1 Tax=Bacteroides sp. 224 TaxID=2302936 RepID=UPI0013D4352D|nr:acyloxyacyl hydrolase [Bacteroides sp. 224]